MGTIARTTWTDDDGSGQSGTILNNNELQKLFDAIDAEVKSLVNAGVQTKTIIDIVMAATYGGDPTTGVGAQIKAFAPADPVIISRWRDVVRG